jgi:hypothetical protein
MFRQNEIFQHIASKSKMPAKPQVQMKQTVKMEGESGVTPSHKNYFDHIFNRSFKSSMLMSMVASVILMSAADPASAKIYNYKRSYQHHNQ